MNEGSELVTMNEFLAKIKKEKIEQLMGIEIDLSYFASIVKDQDEDTLRKELKAEAFLPGSRNYLWGRRNFNSGCRFKNLSSLFNLFWCHKARFGRFCFFQKPLVF